MINRLSAATICTLGLIFTSCGVNRSESKDAPYVHAPSADAAPRAQLGENPCSPLPENLDTSLPLYGDWKAPTGSRGEDSLDVVIAFRPGRTVIQLTCRSPEGSICVQLDNGLVATDKTLRVVTQSGNEASRTVGDRTCSVKTPFASSDTFDTRTYQVKGSTLEFSDQFDNRKVLTRLR